MQQHHRPLWQADRSRRPAATTNAPTPVTWIVAACFAFILIYAFAAPIVGHFTGAGR